MPTNDKVILQHIIEAQRSETTLDMPFDDYFERFVSEQALRSYDLSYEELEAGIVDGGDDIGVDAVYCFINGTPVAEDTDFASYKKDVTLDLYIIQAKTSASFSEAPLDKLRNGVRDLLDLSRDIEALSSDYNTALLQNIGVFRRAYSELASVFPKINVQYTYGSMGDKEHIHPKVVRRADSLKSEIRDLLPGSNVEADLWGARELLEEARRPIASTLQLNYVDSISTEDHGFLCLVRLQDYFDFITDSEATLRQSIFESNVRDYHGRVEVNDKIRGTLASEDTEDFWWLNNGVTVIAANGSSTSKTLNLEDPQIVNGLQTSSEIYRYFSENPRVRDSDNRTVLVRIIVTDNSKSRDKIITATNSQTTLPPASLRAHDQVQRDIEDYLLGHGIFYERRKNFYKNQKRPRDRIVSIPYLAQAIVAILLKKPDDARARPSSLLKRDETYAQVFNSKYPIRLYLVCAQAMMVCDAYIKGVGKERFSQEERNNIRFHVAMQTAMSELGDLQYSAEHIADMDLESLTEDSVASHADTVVGILRQWQSDTGDTTDRIAKSSGFVRELVNAHSR